MNARQTVKLDIVTFLTIHNMIETYYKGELTEPEISTYMAMIAPATTEKYNKLLAREEFVKQYHSLREV